MRDLLHTQSIAIAIARQAGEILLHHLDHPAVKQTKQTSIDLVTQADTESEAVIVSALQKAFPDDHIVGEEGGGYGPSIEEAAYRWYVDPLDGTTNYAHRIPQFCVSIALADRDRVPQVGVVYNPAHNELYYAARGHGAYDAQGKRLAVSKTDALARSLLVTGFPYDKWTNPDNNIREFSAFLLRCQGVRRMGSAALDFAYVADGRFDGYWEMKLNPWDCQAGILLVQEAGGLVTDYHGGQSDDMYTGHAYIASNGHIHAEMVHAMSEIRTRV